MRPLRQGTGKYVAVGPFKGPDGSPVTSLTPSSVMATFLVDRDDGQPPYPMIIQGCSDLNNSLTHVATDVHGMFYFRFLDEDLAHCGSAMLHFAQESVFVDVWHEFVIYPPAVFDALFPGTALLPVRPPQSLGGTAPSGSLTKAVVHLGPENAGLAQADLSIRVTKRTAGATPASIGYDNFATPGEPATSIPGRYGTTVGTVTASGAWLLLMAGTNDLIASASAATIFAALCAEADLARADGKLVACGHVLPSALDFGEQAEAERVALNALMDADAGAHFDKVFDFTVLPEAANTAATLNRTYWTDDATHPTAALCTLFARYLAGGTVFTHAELMAMTHLIFEGDSISTADPYVTGQYPEGYLPGPLRCWPAQFRDALLDYQRRAVDPTGWTLAALGAGGFDVGVPGNTEAAVVKLWKTADPDVVGFALLGEASGADVSAELAAISGHVEQNNTLITDWWESVTELSGGPGSQPVFKPAVLAGAPSGSMSDEKYAALAKEATVLGQFGVTWGLTYPPWRRDGLVRVPRGDAYTLTWTAPAAFPLTGKRVYFCVQKRHAADNAAAIVNREMTVLDEAARTCSITLTSEETKTAGSYRYEIEIRNADDTGPQTAESGTFAIPDDLRK